LWLVIISITHGEALTHVAWTFKLINHGDGKVLHRNFALAIGKVQQTIFAKPEFPGALYHVMSRGDQREGIFLCDLDCHDFIKTLAEARGKSDPGKLAIAARLRRETTLSVKQIAERLHFPYPFLLVFPPWRARSANDESLQRL